MTKIGKHKLRYTFYFLLVLNYSPALAQINSVGNTIFPMDYAPHEETSTEIRAREIRLMNRKQVFNANLKKAIVSNTLGSWIENYITQFGTGNGLALSYSTLTHLCLDSFPQLKQPLIDSIKANIPRSYQTFQNELLADAAAGFTGGYPRDLFTVHPARDILENAYNLKLLGAYDSSTESFVKNFIFSCVENKGGCYLGDFQTTGYNKEIFAIDVAFWIKMLYGDQPTLYPKSIASFESTWNGIMNCSYDGDNSPHYDAGTGVFLVLHWAYLLGREDVLRNTPHLHRILDRMAKTVMNSGENAKWTKCMGAFNTNYSQYCNDAGVALVWVLQMAYRIFNDPFYLYVARKYEDARFNAGVTRWQGDICNFWPIGINYSNVSQSKCPKDSTCYTTNRITTSSTYANGMLLLRADTNYKIVQDKLILSTGHHPRSPYFLMDLSYTQSKAATDRRIGIDNLMFDGTNVSSYLDRPGEAFRSSRPFIAPDTLPFPVLNVVSGDYTPSAAYKTMMGFNPDTDYVIGAYGVFPINSNASYASIEYTKFQYTGVSALRRLVLLNNGIMVVYDKITSASNSGRNDNVGVLYNIWPSADAVGTNNRWVLQGTHLPTLVDKNVVGKGAIKTLFYFPIVGTATTVSVNTDVNRTNANLSRTYCAQTHLSAGQSAEIISLIIPLKDSTRANELTQGITAVKSGVNYVITIPSPARPIVVTIGGSGRPLVDDGLSSTAITDFSADDSADLRVYPHTTHDFVNLHQKGLNNYTFYGVDGQVVKTGSFSDEKNVDLSSLPSGTYFVKSGSNFTAKSCKVIKY